MCNIMHKIAELNEVYDNLVQREQDYVDEQARKFKIELQKKGEKIKESDISDNEDSEEEEEKDGASGKMD